MKNKIMLICLNFFIFSGFLFNINLAKAQEHTKETNKNEVRNCLKSFLNDFSSKIKYESYVIPIEIKNKNAKLLIINLLEEKFRNDDFLKTKKIKEKSKEIYVGIHNLLGWIYEGNLLQKDALKGLEFVTNSKKNLENYLTKIFLKRLKKYKNSITRENVKQMLEKTKKEAKKTLEQQKQSLKIYEEKNKIKDANKLKNETNVECFIEDLKVIFPELYENLIKKFGLNNLILKYNKISNDRNIKDIKKSIVLIKKEIKELSKLDFNLIFKDLSKLKFEINLKKLNKNKMQDIFALDCLKFLRMIYKDKNKILKICKENLKENEKDNKKTKKQKMEIGKKYLEEIFLPTSSEKNKKLTEKESNNEKLLINIFNDKIFIPKKKFFTEIIEILKN